MNPALNREASEARAAELRRRAGRRCDRSCGLEGRQRGISESPGLEDRYRAPAFPATLDPSHAP